MNKRYLFPRGIALLLLLGFNAGANAQCPTTASCTPGRASNTQAPAFGMGIFNVTLGSINHTTGDNTDGYQDYSCSVGTQLATGVSHPVTVRTNANTGESVRIWIDYDNNGVFDPTGELFFSSVNTGLHSGASAVVPTSAVTGLPLRLRVAADASIAPVPTPCSTPQYSQTEDYRVVLGAPTQAPVAAFTIGTAQACGGTFAFTDRSLRGPATWRWSFGDGTFSTQPNPTHTYAQPGTYAVKLRVCNAFGCDSTLAAVGAPPVRFFAQNPAPVTRQPRTLSYCCGYGLTQVEINPDSIPRSGAGITQLSAPGSAGYEDYACLHRLSVPQAAPIALRLAGTPGVAQVFRVFLDGDNNGIFTSAEQLLVYNGDRVDTYFWLPAATPTNQPLRLRLVADTNAGSADPEADRAAGQVEDYSLVVTPAPCVAPLQGGEIVTVPQSAGPSNYLLERAIYTVVGGSPQAYVQWQVNTRSAPTVWTDIAGAIRRQLTVDEPSGTGRQYRATLRCGTSSATQSQTGTLRTTAVGRFHLACTANGWHIKRVALVGTALNSASDCTAPQGDGYSLYSPLEPGRSATLYRGEAYELQVTTSQNSRVTVFGTWFAGDQPVGQMQPLRVNTLRLQPATLVLDLDSLRSLYSGSTSGVLRLRVRCDNQISATGLPTENSFVASGETEDYVLPVLPRTCQSPSSGLQGGLVAGPAQPQCPTQALTLSVTGHTLGALLQWQVSADNQTWQDVAGQTGRVLQLPTTAPVWYRVQVQGCTAMAYSPAYQVRVQSPLTCYCQPSAAMQGSSAPRFTRVRLLGTTLDNSSSSAPSPAYTAYPGTLPGNTAAVVRGATYAVELTVEGTAGTPVTAAAWLDLDQNGRYDSLEWVHMVRISSPPTGSALYRAELPVSAQARLGTTGLRLRIVAGAPWQGAEACRDSGVSPAGETEDYIVTVVAAPCAGPGLTLTAGTIDWPQPAPCVSLLRSRTHTLGADLQWQYSTTQGGSWVDVPRATGTQLTLPVGARPAAVSYRLRVQCGAAVAYSPDVTVPAGGCQSSCLYDNQWGEAGTPPAHYVDEVVLDGTALATYGSGLNLHPRTPNRAHWRRSPEVPHYVATVVRGTAYPLRVRAFSDALPLAGGVWVDWNHDGDLSPSEYVGLLQGPTGFTTTSLSLAVPSTAVLGPTLLRITATYSSLQATDACYLNATAEAEIEDYLLMVEAQAGPTLPVVTASLCAGAPLRLEARGAGTGATYSWRGPNSFVTTGAVASVPSFSPALAGTYVVLAERNGQRIATSVYVPEAPDCLPTATRTASLASSVLNLAPNPTRGQSTVTWPENIQADWLRLRSLTGQMIREHRIATPKSGQYVLDLQRYPAGLYVVELETPQGRFFVKLIRE